MGDGSNIANRANFEAGSLQSPYGRIAAGPWSLHAHFECPHACFARPIPRRHGRLLRSERCSLS